MKTTKSHILLLKLTNKIDLWRGEKVLLYENLEFIIHGKTWKTDTNKFKVSPSAWNDKADLTNGSYGVSDIQDYSDYIKKT